MAGHLEDSTASAKDVAHYEMTMVCLIAQENMAITKIERIIAVNRRLYPKDPILKKVQLGRTKATAIITDGIHISNQFDFMHLIKNDLFHFIRVWSLLVLKASHKA